ncbi:MAG: penicillin-binding protein 1A [Rhodospirillales bacterium]|nr:penicillin-binding protein 1A [Rhodospirillales bacterium]
MKLLGNFILWILSLGLLGAIAALGFVAILFQYYASDLPDYKQLKNYAPPIVTRLYAGDGRLMAEYAQEKRVFIPIDEIPDQVKNAFIAVEDKNFYQHEGVDPTAIMRAVVIYARHKMGQNVDIVGGSTITQQVVKNFLLTNERSFERKIKEAILAYRMERALTKDQILELYLNQIYLGSGTYGVAAAALHYFDKSLEELSLAEIGYLGALPKGPENYHPVRNHDAALERRNYVLKRMEEEHFVTPEAYEEAILQPLLPVDRSTVDTVSAPYFAEEVRRELMERYGHDKLYAGGLSVHTSVDPKLQDYALSALRDGLMAYDKRHGWHGVIAKLSGDTLDEDIKTFNGPDDLIDGWDVAVITEVSASTARLRLKSGGKGTLAYEQAKWTGQKSLSAFLSVGDVIAVEQTAPDSDRYKLQQIPKIRGAIVVIDPNTGRILAMQGGWRYGTDQFNRATQAMRQPGSAFKPFVYLAALEKGFTPATLILDAPFVIEDRPGHFWSPKNYSDEYYGPTPLRVGIEKSRNLMTVRLANYVGMDTIVEIARRFGIMDNMPPNLSNALGAGETTLFRLTSAYAMILNGGKKLVPSFIDRIQDRYGNTIYRHDTRACPACGKLLKWEGQPTPDVPDDRPQIADPLITYQMVSIMEGVVQRGTAVRLKSMGHPLAGKTGTTNESRDAWFIGFSSDLVVGVYIGFDNPQPLGKKETGSSVAVPVFQSFMEQALKGKTPMPFRVPKGIKQVRIDAQDGTRATPGDTKVIWEAFLPGTEPDENVYLLDGDGRIRRLPASLYRDNYIRMTDQFMPADDTDHPVSYTDRYTGTLRPTTPINTGTGGLY